MGSLTLGLKAVKSNNFMKSKDDGPSETEIER